jgi:hypothetical protein
MLRGHCAYAKGVMMFAKAPGAPGDYSPWWSLRLCECSTEPVFKDDKFRVPTDIWLSCWLVAVRGDRR